MSARREGARGVIARIRLRAASSAWAPLAGRAAAYLLGFVLLALAGSGRMTRWLAPAPHIGISVAEAATAASAAVTAATAPPAASAKVEAEPARATVDAEVASTTADGGAPMADADGGAASAAVAADGKVILNLATEDDLRRLPGVGRTRALGILALRGRMKKFTRVEDLLKVKGIGRRFLARLRPLVRVD